MSDPAVSAYDSVVSGSFAEFLTHSKKIGGDVDAQAQLLKHAFSLERDFLTKVSSCKEPSSTELQGLLKPISDKIADVQKFREAHRSSTFFNHLSTISESVPALGWIAVSPAPGPYVKEMSDAGQFYSNRVLKDYKEKDPVHAQWVKAWVATLSALQAFIKQHHTTGVQWNKKGASAQSSKAGPPAPPGPPPPPVLDPSSEGSGSDAGRGALFSELSKGENVTKGLRKVTDDMKTHKNPTLRAGDTVPAKTSAGSSSPRAGATTATAKPPKFALEGKKWMVEYQTGKKDLVIKDADMKQTVYMFKCVDCVLTIKGKINAITLDGCKKTAIVFDEAISSVEFVNCQSVQAQILVKVPTVSIEKTDGCMVYLSKDSLSSQIVTAKSSEMNILVPDPKNAGDFKEFPIPEQFRTHWDGKKFVTETTDSIG
jgi:adenylyl cyclase-associated protein